jgi:hypothetical protein
VIAGQFVSRAHLFDHAFNSSAVLNVREDVRSRDRLSKRDQRTEASGSSRWQFRRGSISAAITLLDIQVATIPRTPTLTATPTSRRDTSIDNAQRKKVTIAKKTELHRDRHHMNARRGTGCEQIYRYTD